MKILVNEIERELPDGLPIEGVAAAIKPDADVLILNGFAVKPGHPVCGGDRVVLIKRGETPSEEELEALMAARHTPGVHAMVKAAHVGVAGIGGLGSHVATALARLGVGKLTLVDFDLVEPSNLNRQYYFIDQLGMPKPEALCQTLRRINPFVALDPHHVRITPGNVASLFGGCDVLVEAFDAADQKAMIVETALSELDKTVVIAGSGLAGHSTTETIHARKLAPRLIVVGDLESEARPGMGLMAPRVGVASHIQANEALRVILGE